MGRKPSRRSITITQVDMRGLAIRPHRGVIVDDRTDWVGMAGEQTLLVPHGHGQARWIADDALRSLKILATVPPDFHDAVEAGIMDLAGHRVTLRREIPPDIAHRIWQRRLGSHLLC